MSGYDVEHGVDMVEESKPRRRGRPDLSSFWSMKKETFGDGPTHNTHAQPTPGNVTGMMRMLADVYQVMLSDHPDNELLPELITELDAAAQTGKTEGMPESFFADLDRIPKSKLKKGEECPICANEFLDDPYPLVVRLPCHPDHKFDLECIQTWLTLRTTCPLDRKVLLKKKEPPPKVDDDEEDYDDYYA
ncbi:uncharacterized protein PV09_04592 [Verruconis gallopava]|uniref:RING-type domain-containing protein n=1 Tax=Verruconis gallopava TaxID=253628 RepID=A0A0D1XNZ2_9PEZI|nr:uncharacterized protein PV09_04592 [Verruconis gallopava]KIW04296.1 hypothetical protein PV09_04592 [Verruconis gallopava]